MESVVLMGASTSHVTACRTQPTNQWADKKCVGIFPVRSHNKRFSHRLLFEATGADHEQGVSSNGTFLFCIYRSHVYYDYNILFSISAPKIDNNGSTEAWTLPS